MVSFINDYMGSVCLCSVPIRLVMKYGLALVVQKPLVYVIAAVVVIKLGIIACLQIVLVKQLSFSVLVVGC